MCSPGKNLFECLSKTDLKKKNEAYKQGKV